MSVKIPILVFAGDDDEYTLLHIPARLQGNKQEIYREVSQRIMPRLLEDFGQGVELVMGETHQVFYISVEKVIV